jgi:iron complex outermembrane receptor protein
LQQACIIRFADYLCNTIAFGLRGLLFIFMLIAYSAAAGQDCTLTIRGQITDLETGAPLPFTTISCCVTGTPALSDIHGNFMFTGLCPGMQVFVISGAGSETDTLRFTVYSDTTLTMAVQSHARLLNELQVTEAHDHSIGGEQLVDRETTAGMATLSSADMLASTSGVQVIRSGHSIAKPVVRGMHSNRLVTLNEGLRMEGQQWGSEHALEFDPLNTEEMVILKGAGSLCYAPDAIAGVLLIDSPKPISNAGIAGDLILAGADNGWMGTSSANISYRSPRLPQLGARIQGTLRRSGNIRTPDALLNNTGMSEQHFSGTIGWTDRRCSLEAFYAQFNTALGIYSGSHIGNLTDLQKAIQSPEPLETGEFIYRISRPMQKVTHELMRVRGLIQLHENHKLWLIYGRQYNRRQEFDKHGARNDSLAALNLPEMHLELTTHTGEMRWEAELSRTLELESGIFGSWLANTHEGRFFIPNYRKNQLAVYSVLRWHNSRERVSVEAGLRGDMFRQTAFFYINDSLAMPEGKFAGPAALARMIYSLPKSARTWVEISTTWRPPGINELYSDGLHHSAASIETGDATLSAERAYTLSAGSDYRGKKWQYSAELFGTWFSNYLYLKPEENPVLTIRGAFPAFRYAQASAMYCGGDASAQWTVVPWLQMNADISIVRAWNLDLREWLVMTPSDRFRLSARIQAKGNKILDQPFLKLGTTLVPRQTKVENAIDFLPPPATYVLLDAEIGVSFIAKTGNIRCGMRVTNLLNARYRDYLNRFRYFTDEQGRSFHVFVHIPLIKNHQPS